MSELFQQLKEKHLVRTAFVYVGGAWLLLEATGFFVDNYTLSRSILDIVVLLVVLGFPAALIIGWFHGETGPQRVVRLEAALLLTLCVLAAIGTYRITTATEVPRTSLDGDLPAPAARLAADDLGDRAIAVLPFTNATGLDSLDWIGSGVSDMLTTSLARDGEMRVVSPQRLFELLRGAGREETDVIPDDVAMQIAGEAGARRMIRGSVLGTLDDLVLDVQLIDLRDGTVVGGDRVRGKDVFAMSDSLAAWVADALAVRPEPRVAGFRPERSPLALSGDPERLKEYSRAIRSAWSEEGVDANYRVADLLGEWAGREGEVRIALEEIVAIDPDDVRALGGLVRVAAAAADPVALDSLIPRYIGAESDPGRAQMTIGRAYERIGRPEAAREVYRSMLAGDLADTPPLDRLARTYLEAGQPAEARAELEALDLGQPELAARAELLTADTHAWEGNFDAAVAGYARAERLGSTLTRAAALEGAMAVQWVLDPSEGAVRLNRAVWTLLERGRAHEALNVIEGADRMFLDGSDRLAPVDAHVLLYARARALELLEARPAAIAAYTELLADWGRVIARLPVLADASARRAALEAG